MPGLSQDLRKNNSTPLPVPKSPVKVAFPPNLPRSSDAPAPAHAQASTQPPAATSSTNETNNPSTPPALKTSPATSTFTRATKFPGSGFKFTSAETESNTHANSYTFGSSAYTTPAVSPGCEIGNPLTSTSTNSSRYSEQDNANEVERQTCRQGSFMQTTPGSNHRVRGARSRSSGGFNGSSRAGSSVDGHYIDPTSPFAAFEHRIGFDTFDNKHATDFSLTLQSKHLGYKFSRLSRTFMCGTDKNEYSENALSWLLEKLADDGDEILCLRVIDPSSKISSSDKALEEKRYRNEAHKFLEHLISKNVKDKKISLCLEFAVGSVENIIKRMIEIYQPSILVVGTKGRSIEGFKGLLPGSVSKWCLQHSPIPVVVVKPTDKRDRKKPKRDPNHISYLDMKVAEIDEQPKVYHHMSSSSNNPPRLPIYLRRDSSSGPISAISSSASAEDPGDGHV